MDGDDVVGPDAHPMDRYYVVIALTFFGFLALAAILLVPVYLFLKKEEDVARNWTDETVARVPQKDHEAGVEGEAAEAPANASRSRG